MSEQNPPVKKLDSTCFLRDYGQERLAHRGYLPLCV